MIYKTEVTQEDINRGVPRLSGKDPNVFALSRSTGIPKERIEVNKETVTLFSGDDKKRKYIVVLPLEVVGFIEMYDQHEKVKPINYTIEIPRDIVTSYAC